MCKEIVVILYVLRNGTAHFLIVIDYRGRLWKGITIYKEVEQITIKTLVLINKNVF